jgi:hypothetical protein
MCNALVRGGAKGLGKHAPGELRGLNSLLMPLLVLRNGHKLSLSTRTLGTLRCTRRFSFAPLFHPVTTLSHAYLDLGTACHSLPLPGFLPPYAAAIIGATILLRISATLPVAIWVRLLCTCLMRCVDFSVPQTV